MSGVAEHDVEATDDHDRADVDYASLDPGSPTRVGGEDHYEATAVVDGEDRPVRVTRPRLQGRLRKAADRYLAGATEWAAVAHHDGVVSILDWGTDDGVPWVVADRPAGADGDTLRDRIDADDGLDPETAVRIAESCARTLQSVHEHLVYHRALVPERIHLDDASDDPVIADVGTARALDESAGSFESLSVAYAAPEQFDRERFHPLPESGADQRIDVYRLGAVLYEALTGRRPYPETGTDLVERVTDPDDDPAAPSEHAEDLPEGTDDVVLRALSTHPGDRYWTADAFAAALADLLGEGDRYPDREWTQSGAGAHHRARVVDEGPDPDSLQSDWTADLNPSAHDPDHEADPVAVDGDTVYFVDHDPHGVVAADADTGNELWRYDLDSVNDGVAVHDGVVCVTTTLAVVGLDADDGTELWRFESEKTEDDIDPEAKQPGELTRRFHHPPVVADDSFLVGCDDHFLYRLAPESGAVEWEFQAYYWIRRAPAVQGGTVYVGTHAGTLHAVDLDTGDQEWSVLHDSAVEDRERGSADDGPVVVGYDRVFLDHHEELQAIEADTGELLWEVGRTEVGEVDAHPGSPALGGGLVVSGTEKEGLVAYDAATGDRLWAARVEYEAGESSAASHGDCWRMLKPALSDGLAYVGCARSSLHVVDCDTGEFRTEFESVDDGVATPVVLAGDGAYYTTPSNVLERVGPAVVEDDENVFEM